ncbi:hypothetical protein, partial [Paenibacillus darwinianus]|uniref:hypothetical protein n=1 Tax=Paenibacillus darwinianus TaxID=1380763 RepID=UPI0016803C19
YEPAAAPPLSPAFAPLFVPVFAPPFVAPLLLFPPQAESTNAKAKIRMKADMLVLFLSTDLNPFLIGSISMTVNLWKLR